MCKKLTQAQTTLSASLGFCEKRSFTVQPCYTGLTELRAQNNLYSALKSLGPKLSLVAGAWTEREKMFHGGSFLKLADDNMDIQNPEAQNRELSGF